MKVSHLKNGGRCRGDSGWDVACDPIAEPQLPLVVVAPRVDATALSHNGREAVSGRDEGDAQPAPDLRSQDHKPTFN